MSATVRRLMLLVALFALSGFSAVADAEEVDISGCWSGRWKSHCTGHQGPISATICKVNNDTYYVKFKGRFFAILPFRYDVRFHVVRDKDNPAEDGTVTLVASKYLGRLFGTFHFTGTSDGCKLQANYTSCRDRGVFNLCRQ